MSTYVVMVTERRTYEIEADTEAAAIERAAGDPDDLPIGSLVSTARNRPMIVRSRGAETDAASPTGGTEPEVPGSDIDRTLLNQPWG